jgi:xanthine dehydrogenase YagS FAD-binding subunit
MRDFTHHNARSIDQAVTLLSKQKGEVKLNAGGTDLLGVLKDDILPAYPRSLVNVKTIPALDYIRRDDDAIRLGALSRLSDIAVSPLLTEECRVLVEATLSVAMPQIRNMATLGGNLCQDTRCWYYRYPNSVGGFMQCARKGSGPCLAVKGDNRYHAILNGKKCFAVCPSDTAVALAALDAQILIVGPKGERSVATADFYDPMGNALDADEMVREVEIPVRKAASRQVFSKFTLRKPIDFAVVSVASVLTLQEGLCADARIVLGAIAPGPFRAEAAEKVLIGRSIDEHVAGDAAEAALAGARPLSKNAYKVQIAKTLVKRAILGGDRPVRSARRPSTGAAPEEEREG